jgi:hypothetical protein
MRGREHVWSGTRGALQNPIGWVTSLPAFEFPMYKTKSCLKNGREFSSWGLLMSVILLIFL